MVREFPQEAYCHSRIAGNYNHSPTYVWDPPGGVLSPRMWNITFDPLLRCIKNKINPFFRGFGPKSSLCEPYGFADDIAMTFTGPDPNTLVLQAQPFIDMAVEWGGKNGLTFSTDKTTVFFSIGKMGLIWTH